MKVAKPDQAMFDAVDSFANACEEMFENGIDSYENWDEDDEDRKLILRIRKDLATEEGCEPEEVHPGVLAYWFLRRRYHNRLKHIIFTAKVLMDNVQDPFDDCLAFHPMLCNTTRSTRTIENGLV